MGTFHVAVEVANLQGDRSELVEALVDTGASHSVFPASLLRQLGVEAIERWPFRLADDHEREFEVGPARLRMFGRERINTVVFGDESMSPLIGALTLEDFWLAVDPTAQRLIEVPGLLMLLENR